MTEKLAHLKREEDKGAALVAVAARKVPFPLPIPLSLSRSRSLSIIAPVFSADIMME